MPLQRVLLTCPCCYKACYLPATYLPLLLKTFHLRYPAAAKPATYLPLLKRLLPTCPTRYEARHLPVPAAGLR